MATNEQTIQEQTDPVVEEVKETGEEIEKVTETGPEGNKSRIPLMVAAALILVVGGGVGALGYILASNQMVYIEDSSVSAPMTVLSPTVAGTLMQVYVSVGDVIPPNTVVAEVGTQLVNSTAGGLVISTNTNIGTQITPGTAVVTTIDPSQLRVVGQLEEDKGLNDVAVGDSAKFTVDAFPGQTFYGVVSEVSPTDINSDVVFEVSDQREEQKFNVSVAYDLTKYPQLRNGMSAKIWVFKK
jgi:multidrug resistance efflux pump